MPMTNKVISTSEKVAPIIDELRKLITENSRDNSKLNEIMKSLQSIGSWHIIEPLKETLEIPNCTTQIKQKVLELFGKIQDPRVFSVLVSYSENSDNRIRNTAIKSLSLQKNPKVTGYLISALKAEQSDKWVKIFAIHGLTRNASPKVIQPLIDLLGDPEEEIRKEALSALAKLKTENIDDLLIQALTSQDRFVRLGAVNLIGERLIEKSIDELLKLVGSKDLRLNLLVCNTLSKLSSSKALLPLLEQATMEEDLANRYVLCIQKMDNKVISPLIDIYLRDTANIYKESIEFILSKTGLYTHELIIDRKSTETNPEMLEKLEILEKNIGN